LDLDDLTADGVDAGANNEALTLALIGNVDGDDVAGKEFLA